MSEDQTKNLSDVLEQNVRPAKRRKFIRKRTGYEDEVEADGTAEIESVIMTPSTTPLPLDELVPPNGNVSGTESQKDEEPRLSVAEILRQCKATQRRRGGIEFSNTDVASKSYSNTPQPDDAVIEKDEVSVDVKTVVNRFAAQTGQVADVDKHMMAYIDTELAKRRNGDDMTNVTSNGQSIQDSSLRGTTIDSALHRQPAALGKLHEIDLGPDATLRNIARTEAAKRRLAGVVEDVEEATGKIRLRRDGKPWRARRRRNSEDVKRDKLVEEVLRESRLEIYDEPDYDQGNDDQAADDRIAEQFRREFMDAISSRKQRTGPVTTTKPVKGAKVEDKPKGPKLGGSRMARAAMREQQEKALKK